MKKIVEQLKKNIVLSVVAVVLLANFGVSSASLLGKNAVPEYVMDMVNKIDVVYMYSTDEMVRFVEKQYTKVTEKPSDFYPSDLEYCMDSIWPAIPDGKKTASLVSKYNYLVKYYNDQISLNKMG